MFHRRLILGVSIGLVLATSTLLASLRPREAADTLFAAGHFAEALQGYRQELLDPATDDRRAAHGIERAQQCLIELGQVSELDTLWNQVLPIHPKKWRFLAAVGTAMRQAPSSGKFIAGEFERGSRGRGRYGNTVERDRAHSILLLFQATQEMQQSDPGVDDDDRIALYLSLANSLSHQRNAPHLSWARQTSTSLDPLPPIADGWYNPPSTRGAPVTSQGTPLYYDEPAEWSDAKNDGERLRWALARASAVNESGRRQAQAVRAQDLHMEFGVQTLADLNLWSAPWEYLADDSSGDSSDDSSGDSSNDLTEKTQHPYAVSTLSDSETLARLANGAKRFSLPDAHNFIAIYENLAQERDEIGIQARATLARIYANRRQYVKAAAEWQKLLSKPVQGQHGYRSEYQQIVGNLGRFEPSSATPAGRKAELLYRFRNGSRVTLTAHRLNRQKLAEDIKAYVTSNPDRLDWGRLRLDNLDHRILDQHQREYIGAKVAEWSVDLVPAKEHQDRRAIITTPFDEAGLYWVEARMASGNSSHVLVELNSHSVVRKSLGDGQSLFYVADAVTSEPIAGATVEVLSYQQKYEARTHKVYTDQATLETGNDGTVRWNCKLDRPNILAVAKTPSGERCYLGFGGSRRQRYDAAAPSHPKVFFVTDRPVYRPGQTAFIKAWVGKPDYQSDAESAYAGQAFKMTIHDSRGKQILEQHLTADAWGGVQKELILPDDAALGSYWVRIDQLASSSFRVEEYKKPEYEVTIDLPKEPLTLGDTTAVTVTAKYYFGAPVSAAKVNYTVLRQSVNNRWFPSGRWDWLYGSGYAWPHADAPWHPGFKRWGCLAPFPWWWSRPAPPPELIAQGEAQLNDDGEYQLEISTELAKLLHGDQDHQYRITAEVTDPSRRTVVGQGSLHATRQPFQVVTWIDRGFLREGDSTTAHLQARRLDGSSVSGNAEFRLYRLQHKEQKVSEELLQTWRVEVGDEGTAEQRLTLRAAGQYRLAAVVTHGTGPTVEGGLVFSVLGNSTVATDFQYKALELIPDKSSYQPGDTVDLLVNADRPNSAVLLFLRPVNGVYLPPKLLKLNGKSQVTKIPVTAADYPNFFVEALTLSDGQLHSESLQIVVPPQQRVLDVVVEPNAEAYEPGAPATVAIRVRDQDGNPQVGSVVLAVYDRALDAIAGGSNVRDIRAAFWQWKRNHYPRHHHNLGGRYGNKSLTPADHMQDLGVFGGAVSEGAMAAGGTAGAPAPGGRLRDTKSRSLGQRGSPLALGEETVTADAALDDDGEDGGAGSEAETRSNFADTAFWAGSLETDESGLATVSFDMPDNLTSWSLQAWSLSTGTRVGSATARVVTRKNLMIRLQAPRFFTERDEVTLSANVHNEFDQAQSVRVALELEGSTLEGPVSPIREIEIAAHSQARVDWRVRVVREGEAVVRMSALSTAESDAVEQRFPVYVHGAPTQQSWAGSLSRDAPAKTIRCTAPLAQRRELARLELRFSPSIAAALVDALPYLSAYPYDSTDQTLTRFLPTVITHSLLSELGVDLEAAAQARTNLNPQELGDPATRKSQWKRFDAAATFDPTEVKKRALSGITALAEMQLSDGGWGWFTGYYESSTPLNTALVVKGLYLAQQHDLVLPDSLLERGSAWLVSQQEEQIRRISNAVTRTQPYKSHADASDALVYRVLAMLGHENEAMRNYLYRDRLQLNAYAQGLLALALHDGAHLEQRDVVRRNIEQFLETDDENDTAWLRLAANHWWSWHGSLIEANATYLQLLCRVDPKSPIAPKLVKYLLNNRKHASYWRSTRDTALCIEALAEYLQVSAEADPELDIEVWVAGKQVKTTRVDAKTLFTFDNTLILEARDVPTGEFDITLRKSGRGPLYYNLALSHFSLEDSIPAAGLEVKVERHYRRLLNIDSEVAVPNADGSVTGQRIEKFERKPLQEGDTLESGDLIEVELVIESKNDYEHLVFEDLKGSGFEPVDLRSGYSGDGLGAYREFRDRHVAFLVTRLPQGRHSMTYRIRAEVPGTFGILPTQARGVYAPELQGNSSSLRLNVRDQ